MLSEIVLFEEAEAIVVELERAKRLVSTTCDHRAWTEHWAPIEKRGIYCLACNMILTQEQMACLSDAGESGE